MTSTFAGLELKSPVRWSSPETGSWVASRRGRRTGAVRRESGQYIAATGRGREVGVFESLADALVALDAGADQSSRRQVKAWTLWLAAINAAMATALALTLLAVLG